VTSKARPKPQDDAPAGLGVRRRAVEVAERVLAGRETLDAALEQEVKDKDFRSFEPRDKALFRAIVSTLFRRRGQVEEALSRFLDRPLPDKAERARTILMVGATQILFLDIPDHAAVSIAVSLASGDRRARPWKALVNGVLRRVAENREQILATQNPERLNTPRWLWKRWRANYGEEVRKRIAAMHLLTPGLDLTAKGDPAELARAVGGEVLPTGSVRLAGGGRVEDLPGYKEGTFWVQDAAAALPARLLGAVAGKRIADLCAAPGGKTAQLAAAGADVVAVDRSARRLKRLQANLARLGLTAEAIAADLLEWQPEGLFDGILLDAPCCSTGTLRRHPDTGWARGEAELARLADLQAALLARAAQWLEPGGVLVYCTCSLEPEEGEERIERFLAETSGFERVPIRAEEVGGLAEILNQRGELRSLPCHLAREDARSGGLDGFFAARLRRV